MSYIFFRPKIINEAVFVQHRKFFFWVKIKSQNPFSYLLSFAWTWFHLSPFHQQWCFLLTRNDDCSKRFAFRWLRGKAEVLCASTTDFQRSCIDHRASEAHRASGIDDQPSKNVHRASTIEHATFCVHRASTLKPNHVRHSGPMFKSYGFCQKMSLNTFSASWWFTKCPLELFKQL